jgi:serine/threonine protein kinase
MREPAVDLSGTILDGRYLLLGQLGRGGMGNVYSAVHVVLDQRVAIKVLHPRLAENERFRARFLQEARAASRIRHPNVVEIRDFGMAPNGSVYFVMEYLCGHDLSVELCRQGALPWARARNILLQAAGALQASHAKQIIHRDIKPGNCFLLEDEDAGLVDVIKLVDFGIAKVGNPLAKRLTAMGEVLGTISYMSPEQARCKPLDARSDVYSLGAMAYEMLTGLVPFRANNALRVITSHAEEPPEPVRRLAPQVPPAVDAIVLKMLAKAPEDRYPSMNAVAQALRAIPETAGQRSTWLWTPSGAVPSAVSHGGWSEPAPPRGSVARGPLAAPAGSLEDDEPPTLRRPEPSRSRRRAGDWSAMAPTGENTLVGTSSGAGSSTVLGRATNDATEPKPRTPMRPRSSRRVARLALLGLLGLLAGGGSTMLVTDTWLSNDGARESREGRAAQRDERGGEQQQPASGGHRSSRWRIGWRNGVASDHEVLRCERW